ncbi:hypothetical protein F5880DRAFT_1331875 [Lentinula raphanica]|nr:hypothetical protein F5880DRAFT_1331875 [Lentinula raphanica]
MKKFDNFDCPGLFTSFTSSFSFLCFSASSKGWIYIRMMRVAAGVCEGGGDFLFLIGLEDEGVEVGVEVLDDSVDDSEEEGAVFSRLGELGDSPISVVSICMLSLSALLRPPLLSTEFVTRKFITRVLFHICQGHISATQFDAVQRMKGILQLQRRLLSFLSCRLRSLLPRILVPDIRSRSLSDHCLRCQIRYLLISSMTEDEE